MREFSEQEQVRREKLKNIKNPYLETSAWGWQIDALLVQKSH